MKEWQFSNTLFIIHGEIDVETGDINALRMNELIYHLICGYYHLNLPTCNIMCTSMSCMYAS